MTLVGKKAPYFSASAVINGNEIEENFNLPRYIGKKNILFFFYPKDFTSICAVEINSFQERSAELEKSDTVIIGCSTDTEETHLAWLNTPKDSGGIEGVSFPIIADTTKIVSLTYGVLGGEYNFDSNNRKWSFAGSPGAYNGTFLIDKKGIIRYESVNDFSLSRNISEYIRLIDAQQHAGKYGEVFLVNKEQKKKVMIARDEDSTTSFMKKVAGTIDR